jgi:flagellar FliJ protein
MPKFDFRLAPLLRLREATRDGWRVELAQSQRTDLELQHQLMQIEQQQKRLQRQWRQAAGPGEVDLPCLAEADRYAASLRAQEEQLRQQRRTLAAEIDRQRQALIEADRDVRTLEKLRENQFQAHCHEENRQDAKRLDEAALQGVER